MVNSDIQFDHFGIQSTRKIRKTVYVSVEGEKTEMQYFNHLNFIIESELGAKDIHIEPMHCGIGSDPINVLNCMKDSILNTGLEKEDEAWLVVDKNNWNEQQFDALEKWTEECPEKFFWALSNPNFEFWLLLHFQSGKGITKKKQCLEMLKKYFPDYKKHIDVSKLNLESIRTALKNARSYGDINNFDCRKISGRTTVDKLVSKIVEFAEK